MHPLKLQRHRRKGALAQLVEQRTENPCVPGSIPGGTTLKKAQTLENIMFLKGLFFTGKLYGQTFTESQQ